MPKPRQLYDAFPTQAMAKQAAGDLRCGAVVRKLKQPQDGGRLTHGVYAPANCARTIAYNNMADLVKLADGRGRSMSSGPYRAPWKAGPLAGARVRTTRDLYVVQGNYGYGHGWEDVTAEDDRKQARQRLKEYIENSPGAHRLIKRRVRI